MGGADLDMILAGAVEEAASRARTLRVDLQLSAGTLGECAGDPDSLGEVVRRLLSNALINTPPGGQVTLGGRRAGTLCVLHVDDNGFGIPGAGIALRECRAAVERHGGRLRIGGAPGMGTTASVILPAIGPRA
jgi:signal transduction histidine kinase